MTALTTQIGGTHYKDAKIQPIQYIEANELGFLEGCVLKRVTRHDKSTGKGRQDIEKAIHELQLLLEFRYPADGVEIGNGLPGGMPNFRCVVTPLVEPASEIDDESPRADAIGKNGNTGEHYDAQEEVDPDPDYHKYNCTKCGFTCDVRHKHKCRTGD